MNFSYQTVIFPIVLLAACAPTQYKKDTKDNWENIYTYTSVLDELNYFTIHYDKYKEISYADEVISDKIFRGFNENQQTLLSFDWPHNVAFYLPKDFGAATEEWAYGACDYKVISYIHGYRPTANQVVHEYLIEQQCDGDAKAVRYEYADYYGLQSFGIGEYKENSEGEMVFELQDVYSLFGAEIGFGAVSKE